VQVNSVGEPCLSHSPKHRARRHLLTLCQPIRQTVQVCKYLIVSFALDISLQYYIIAEASQGVVWLRIGRVVWFNAPPCSSCHV